MVHHHRRRIIILTPSSTPQSLVFPYDRVNKKFSTTSYIPLQTQDRLSIQEVEQFLEQASIPINEWYEQYGWVTNGSCKFICLLLFCFFIFPLYFFFICWLICYQQKSAKKLQEAAEKSKLFIRDNNQQFIERGLMWNVPVHYPQWIELWTTVGGPQPQAGFPMMPQGQPGYDGFSRPGIPTQTLPQQNYQNQPQQGYYTQVPQNQYNPNVYGPNA